MHRIQDSIIISSFYTVLSNPVATIKCGSRTPAVAVFRISKTLYEKKNFKCLINNFSCCLHVIMIIFCIVDSIKSIIKINLTVTFSIRLLENFNLHVWLTLQYNTSFTIWFINMHDFVNDSNNTNNIMINWKINFSPCQALNCYKILINNIQISDICSSAVVRSWATV